MDNIKFTPFKKVVETIGNIEFGKVKRGRPIDPNSNRQQKLATAPGKKTGRPINPNSNRQQRLRELEMKRANGELKRGRPVNPNSKRQMALREMMMKTLETEMKGL